MFESDIAYHHGTDGRSPIERVKRHPSIVAVTRGGNPQIVETLRVLTKYPGEMATMSPADFLRLVDEGNMPYDVVITHWRLRLSGAERFFSPTYTAADLVRKVRERSPQTIFGLVTGGEPGEDQVPDRETLAEMGISAVLIRTAPNQADNAKAFMQEIERQATQNPQQ